MLVSFMVQNRRWLPYAVPDEVLSPPATQQERTLEQDYAAGGRDKRRITFEDGGEATASVVLMSFRNGRRVYAYLRFKYRQKNRRLYVGEASALTRRDALHRAWCLVEEKELLAKPLPTSSQR